MTWHPSCDSKENSTLTVVSDVAREENEPVILRIVRIVSAGVARADDGTEYVVKNPPHLVRVWKTSV
ncbi:hypothetical protein [Halorussus sp. MSC15.2]|uniref:hypothetical protein n=1 Tax=Halorussus sp. MSC15.2 TaxID=2283638 RepID=UPI0013D776C0|nr:hypothetical protein [Halorussus sp. MSC15.2]NEU59127.1 hypothetical protein [Halorussus sp. MSC15.2]